MINMTIIWVNKLKEIRENIKDEEKIKEIDNCIKRISDTGVTFYDFEQIIKLLTYK